MKQLMFLFITVTIFGCSSEVNRFPQPENLIPKDTMVMVLKDLSILEAHIRNKYPQVTQNYQIMRKSGDLIFKKYHLDTTRFNASLNYYGSRQEEMQAINSQILDSVNREITELSVK